MLAENLEYYAEMEKERLYMALALVIVKPVPISTALIRVAGVNLNTTSRNVSKVGMGSRFSDLDVADMARMREKDNMKYREIADIYNCSPSNIHKTLEARGKLVRGLRGEGKS